MEILKFLIVALIVVFTLLLGFRLAQEKEFKDGSFSAPIASQRPSQVPTHT